MAALKYRDEHNKVGFLEKPKGSADYHQVLDFLRGSHIRYAITHDPIIYDSLVKQFWSTASLRASEEGPPAILATIDRTPYTITESLVRSQLQLDDDGGVEDLPIADIYLVPNQTVPETITEPDHSHDHESTPPRPTTTTSGAPVNEQGPSSDPNIASSSRPHESAPDQFTSTNVEDETMGGSFQTSHPRSTQALPEGTTSGGAEDLDKLTALSSLVSTLVQKVNTQESELNAHKLLFKEVVGKLVKKVKLLEDKLKGRKRKFVMSDSDKEEDAEQDVDPLIKLAKVAATATAASVVPTGEEDPPVRERTFRQRKEDRLGEETARRIYEEEQAELQREREEMQRNRQQDGLLLSFLGPDVTEDNFAERMVALIAKRRREFAAQRTAAAHELQSLNIQEASLQDLVQILEASYSKKPKSITEAPNCKGCLVLWGDLKHLMDSPKVNDGSDVWKNQHTWSIQSWKLYSYSGVHVVETVGGLVVHMFVDKKYPLSINLIERMLDHQLEICHDKVKKTVGLKIYLGLDLHAASTIPVSAAIITDVKITLAQALAELKSAKPKADKHVVEQVKPMKRLEQMRLDEELAFKLQAEEKEEERLAREKPQQIKEANIAWDDVQAKVEANYQLAQRLQAQEQEELTDEENSRAGTELEQEVTKNRKVYDVQETAKVDNDQEAAKIKEHMEIVPDKEEVAIDAISLVVKPLSITTKANNEVFRIILPGDLMKLSIRNLRFFEEEYQVLGESVGIKRLLDDLIVTAAKVMVDAYTWNSTIWRLPPPIRDDWLSNLRENDHYGCRFIKRVYALIARIFKIVMENPNHLNEPNEAIPKVNPIVPEPNQVVDIHDPNKMVDIPDDIDLVDYDEEGLEEDPEEELEEDVEIEVEDDVELIFPYEVEGDKTPPPGDVSFDSVSSDSELKDEEVDVVPEATTGTITQKPYAIRDFPRGLFEVGESSSARDSSHVDGLAPWALRRDLEASRAQARVMEAELGTCQTEIALLKSKDKIGEKEKELLNHDLENVERTLGNVLERMSVLESGENATLKKRLAETETKLVWAHMEPVVLEPMVLEPVVLEPVVPDRQRLKLLGNGRIASMGIDAANGTPWTEVRKWMTEEFCPRSVLQRLEQELYNLKLKGTDIDGYTNRFHELALLCPRMVEPEQLNVEQYIRGLSKNIRGDVTSSRPAGIDEAVRMAYQLMGQIIQDKTDDVTSENFRNFFKGDISYS
ncbi:putative reverse transcriptase domain-containing protein [Tanacetum coccineum]